MAQRELLVALDSNMYHVFDDVLPEEDLNALRRQAKGDFEERDTGYATLLVKRPDFKANNLLNNVIRNHCQSYINDFVSFLRLNKPDFDTAFRVHADRDPLGDGRICNMAAVFYLEEDDSGTALFRHPDHGDRAKEKYVFTEDDGKWEVYFKCQSKANRLFLYDSKLFHGRFPWKVNKDRVVLVKFMR